MGPFGQWNNWLPCSILYWYIFNKVFFCRSKYQTLVFVHKSWRKFPNESHLLALHIGWHQKSFQGHHMELRFVKLPLLMLPFIFINWSGICDSFCWGEILCYKTSIYCYCGHLVCDNMWNKVLSMNLWYLLSIFSKFHANNFWSYLQLSNRNVPLQDFGENVWNKLGKL